MKRRNAEFGKLRRPIKRNKIAEGINTFMYAKYFVIWGVVVTADFMLDFRFELLWPFWLLLRSVYDSYKYKGLTFTILFVCIAITSDLVCMFFIPISWLFFLASTYVWVQYVWHAVDKGACLPTIFLWTIFLYLEGAVRWRDDKTVSHIDLCRPFAAHCIGYPVVTLGFGIKSYIGYRIRHRKQREVAKENEFFIQLLQLALPNDNPTEDELIAQMQQTSEILHSDKFGDIDLPVSSPIITQRIQQQRLLIVSNLLNGSAKRSSVVSSDGNNTHKLINNHTANGFSSQIAVSSRTQSSSATLPIAAVTASTSTAVNSVPTHPQSVTLNHSNNNNLNSSNLNLALTHNGFNMNNHPVNGQTQHLNFATIPTYRNHRRSADRSDNKLIDSDTNASVTSMRNIFNFVGGHTDSGKKFDADNAVSRRFSILYARSSATVIVHMVIGTLKRCHHVIAASFIGTTILMMRSFFGYRPCKNETNTPNRHGTENGINALHVTRTEHSHGGRSTESNGIVNTAIVAPMNAKLSTDTGQPNYSSFQPQATETEKTFCKQNIECDNHFNQLENNCNHGNNVETIERNRGRKNRGKQKDTAQHHLHTCKDNHNNTNVIRNPSPLSQRPEQCESCSRLENEMKRMRNEINQLRHLEHELRSKSDQNMVTKSSLQTKQKENDELERRLHEMVLARQVDKQNLQQTERRLNDERRQKQSIESQLNNERKQRKLTEEKLSRIDCSENCKLRKQILENECKQLRKDLTATEELKKSAEKQSRNYEQELRKFEAELRSREPRESTEVLMSALQAMQEKNKTLEKSLSAETRVKLDLFSALGEAKRQLEIRDNVIRQKDKELVDLKAKIAQLYAVMPAVPSEPYLPQCTAASPPLLRLSDAGPSSPLSHASDAMFTPKTDVS